MKKIALMLALVFVLGIVFTSCKSSACPAYGEYKQYKRERAY
ncbi:MAG: hypothetical protein Q4F69_06020 [Bacteroidia bacterium]|nr:hypothetical protein [Bacteroidia bacterium]